MIEQTVSKFCGYLIFWDRDLRRRFRAWSFEWLIRFENFVFQSTLQPLPKSKGVIAVERRVSIFGISIARSREVRKKYRVALLVDEFFGGWDTPIGGYGALARKYICKFVPSDEIEIDVLLDANSDCGVQKKRIDGIDLFRLPISRIERQRWLDQQGYNIFLSIEMTEPSFRIMKEYKSDTPLLYWIQDPRHLEMYQRRQVTVNKLRDGDWEYIRDVSIYVTQLIAQRRIHFISQGVSLSAIAREMYDIPKGLAIGDLPNPVEIDIEYQLNVPKKENKIVFLGRIEAQKRTWIVCELAKAMPHYEFYILGATGRGRDEIANAQTLDAYRYSDGTSKIPNLHFTGHVDGEIKSHHLKTAKILINTSIWEGIPVSWLEALSFGTLIVAAFDRDELVSRFGSFVGEIMGDGTDDVSIGKLAEAIEKWMKNDSERNAVAEKAIDFIRHRHNIEAFSKSLRESMLEKIR